jgi:two-component system KDP operon response regulator KdpE
VSLNPFCRNDSSNRDEYSPQTLHAQQVSLVWLRCRGRAQLAARLPRGSEIDSTIEAGRRCEGQRNARGPMSNATILVVDDDAQIRRVLQATLSSNGYDVIEAKNGKEAIAVVVRERPNLILLDVNMPGMTGFEACSKIRLSFDGPIIMVTVRDAEQDKVVALDSGADDYVIKPFGISELLARIRAALRRSSADQPLPKIDTPEFSVDLEMRLVAVRGQRVNLSLKEFEVLRALVLEQGKPLTREKLSKIVWGSGHPENAQNLRVVIGQLRKKIEKDPARPRYILTEPWFGYRFLPPTHTP